MLKFRYIFTACYAAITLMFICCSIGLIVGAGWELWMGLQPNTDLLLRDRFNSVLESIGLLTIAVAALELGQTILEEEILREGHISAPTRVRRFLSRFMIVVVVALSIESLVMVFQLAHKDVPKLWNAAAVGLTAAALLAAWGIFVKLNIGAEELEPEAMERAKQEDSKIDGPAKK